MREHWDASLHTSAPATNASAVCLFSLEIQYRYCVLSDWRKAAHTKVCDPTWLVSHSSYPSVSQTRVQNVFLKGSSHHCFVFISEFCACHRPVRDPLQQQTFPTPFKFAEPVLVRQLSDSAHMVGTTAPHRLKRGPLPAGSGGGSGRMGNPARGLSDPASRPKLPPPDPAGLGSDAVEPSAAQLDAELEAGIASCHTGSWP